MNMLKALDRSRLDVDAKQQVLLSVARRMLPHPQAEEPPVTDNPLRQLEDRVLRELGASISDPCSMEAGLSKERAFRLLSEAMSDCILTPEARMAAKQRLGNLGDLPPSQYRIEFRSNFAEHHNKFGIRRSQVEDVLRRPDAVQHLLCERFRGFNGAVSIYIRTIGQAESSRTFTLLVETRRENAIQIVNKAWRIYHSDVDLLDDRSPLGVLKAFVDVYGITYQLVNGEPTKFTFFEEIRLEAHCTSDSFLQVVSPIDALYEGSFVLSPRREDSVLEVSMAYAIDLAKYLPDLRKHGVPDLSR